LRSRVEDGAIVVCVAEEVHLVTATIEKMTIRSCDQRDSALPMLCYADDHPAPAPRLLCVFVAFVTVGSITCTS
jgi:hypothetical protein